MMFKEFNEITKLCSTVTITEKVHGTNAQILIEVGANDAVTVTAGSRNRYLTPDDDNFGFAKWVEANAEALFIALGEGRHYGEWYGLGINSGYGLTEKRFALFDLRHAGKVLPPRVDVVPVLYQGAFRDNVVSSVMAGLLLQGSRIAPGYAKPEGVVVRFERNGALFKHVFELEEVKWTGTKTRRTGEPKATVDFSAYLVPLILEKVVSKDERLLRDYPITLPDIVRGYVAELEQECGLKEADSLVQIALRKGAYPWVKSQLNLRNQ